MSTDALFGPDGTQPPEPPPVLPDPLVGSPAGWGDHDFTAPLPLPPAPDISALREAVRSALGEDVPPRQARPPARSPARPPAQRPPRPAHQQADLRTPPSGFPAQQPPAQPAPALPRRPMSPPAPTSGRPTTARYPTPPPASAPRQAGQPPSPAQQRAPVAPHRPLAPAQRRRSSSIGCIVALIFIAIVVFSIISSIVDAITGS